MAFFIKTKSKTIVIIGQDSKYQADELSDIDMIDVRKDIRTLNKHNSKRIIKDFNNDLDKFIDNNLNEDKSYYGVAPIPFIAMAGLKFRKEKIVDYYEYDSSNDNVKELNKFPEFFFQKLKINKENRNNDNSVICISTTSKINEVDLSQFSGYNISHFYLEKCKDNVIKSKLQLRNYSDTIVKEIYELSRNHNGKIYLVGACQSSLIFEIFRKVNLNRTLDIVVCSYNKNKKSKYCISQEKVDNLLNIIK